MPSKPASSGEAGKGAALTPEEIRAVREFLGLSQRAAGRILGGGERQFQRYEYPSGHPLHEAPSRSLCNLLRLLAVRPGALEHLLNPGSLDLEDLARRTRKRNQMTKRSITAYAALTNR